MKICYVLPQVYKNSAENFYHIVNFLNELGKTTELHIVVERSDCNVVIDNAKQIFVLKQKTNFFNLFRFAQLIKIYFQLYRQGVKTFFVRASLTGVLPLTFANRVLNLNKANIVFWSCGQDVVPLSFRPTKKNFKRLTSKVLSRAVFKGINYLATGPELMVDYYHGHYGINKNKVINLYNDISLERFYPLDPDKKCKLKQELLESDKKVMLFVHTFNRCRGVDLLPLIAEKIKSNNINTTIIAIGREGDYSDKLNREIINKDLENQLINLGEVANRNIVKYYQIADLFLMPSRGEGFPRVLLEAMACGCPTLSFNVGGVANILPDSAINELLVSLDDETKFIEQSIKLINDQKMLEELSRSSYQKVKQYDTNNIVDMYVEQLSNI